MQSKTIIGITAVLVILILVAGAFSAGFITGGALFSRENDTLIGSPLIPGDATAVVPQSDSAENASTPEELSELFEPFWQAWDVAHHQYVDQPLDDVVLMRGAIQGMLESIGDPHTSYLDPVLQERFQAVLNGEEYEGIGAWVDTGGEYLTVISPMPGSPADEAGLLPGDQIIAIDGEDMSGVDPELARQSVLGPKGSTVILTILRGSEGEPFDVHIKRASIVIPTVESEYLAENNLGYVRLNTFGADTSRDLRKALKDVLAEDPQGVILDLRNNGGGYLDVAIQVVSEFIEDGIVMYEEYGDGSMETFKAKKGGLATDIPLVVLINEGSASASEIVAGAIQDRDRGYLVGFTSFGKGSVQNITSLVNDQGQIRVTICRWLTPNQRQINGLGLEPDFIIEISEDDYKADRDPQLDKAIELLTK